MNLRSCIAVPFVAILALGAQVSRPLPGNRVVVDASAPTPVPETGYLHLGGTSSDGHSIQINSQYLVRDGKPWLPVMGEFHFSRYPEAEWEAEILKMQAAGIDIVSTYIFWIHHEEVEGQFDWAGERDLRKFVQLCAKHGMYVWLRVGPWAHGEVRNGGFPDWVQKLSNTRTNDPVYLRYVERFFHQIGIQVQDLMFKDGGPVIGTQLENEYGQHGPGRGADHILKLKQLALAAGIDTPLYSVTGWPSLDFPPHEVVPVSGGYPDGFWFGSQTNLPPSINYLFNLNRELGDMGATVRSDDPTGKVDLRHDPYLAAEEGGGMASAYHRRPVLSGDDVAALTLTGLGSGINLYGYYMFHGGENPQGKLSTLQESSASGYPNDLPERSYDFVAPLGEFGQQRASYGKTRLLHLFVNAFGSQLATMPAFAPVERTGDPANRSIPRVSVRSDGHSGFIFLNNYVRQLSMPTREGLQFHIKLAQQEIVVPSQPMTIPAGAYFVWPFELPLGGGRLDYSTAQLLTQLDTPKGKVVVFFAIPGIQPEFSFATSSFKEISSANGTTVRAGRSTLVRSGAGGSTKIELTDHKGLHTTVLLLRKEEAEGTALFRIGTSDHLVLSDSLPFFDGQTLHLQSTSAVQQWKALPALRLQGLQGVQDGVWTRYSVSQPVQRPDLKLKQLTQGEVPPAMKMGPYVDWRKAAIPLSPRDNAFDSAATWQLQWANPSFRGLSEVLLKIDYAGDMARLKSGGLLLNDDFYNGLAWETGLKRFGATVTAGTLSLQILPMPHEPLIYLDESARGLLANAGGNAQLMKVELVPVYESRVAVEPQP